MPGFGELDRLGRAGTCDGKGNLERYFDVDQTEPYPCPGCEECRPEPGRVEMLPAHGLDLPGLMTLCCFYDSQMSCFQPVRGDAASKYMSGHARLEHVRWMLTEMLTMTNTEKMNRWLGFVQAVLWCGGVFTVDELRKHVQEVSR